MEKEGTSCSKWQMERKVEFDPHSEQLFPCHRKYAEHDSALTRRSWFGYFKMHQHQFSMPRYQDLSTNPLHQPPKKSSQKSSPPPARALVLYLGPKQRFLGGTPCSLSLTAVAQRQRPPSFFHPFSPKRILPRTKRYFVSSNGPLSLQQPWVYHKRITKDSLISLCPFHRQMDVCSPCMSITQKSFKYKWNVTPVILSCCQQSWTFPRHGHIEFLHLIKFM